MPTIVAFVACAILAGLAALQGALLGGAPLGRFAWGGQHDILAKDKRRSAAVMIVLYVFFVLIILQGVGIVAAFSSVVGQIAIWALTAYFFVAFVLAAMSPSRYEQILMAVLNVALAALTLIVAITGHVTV